MAHMYKSVLLIIDDVNYHIFLLISEFCNKHKIILYMLNTLPPDFRFTEHQQSCLQHVWCDSGHVIWGMNAKILNN